MVERQQLVSQINNATAVVYNQLSRLQMLEKRFASMESLYLQQITSSIKTGNNARARILANELSNVRKLRRTTQHTGMALEALVIRFSTMNEFAMILDTIDPTVEMVKGIQAELSKAIPSANDALSEVSSVTADVLSSANVRAEARISTPMDADALNILNEIEGALETEAKAKLPEIPADMPLSHREAREQQQEREEEGGVEERERQQVLA
jgi:division protein CdvB (Snf7/Vps24/ESCRT-III family)